MPFLQWNIFLRFWTLDRLYNWWIGLWGRTDSLLEDRRDCGENFGFITYPLDIWSWTCQFPEKLLLFSSISPNRKIENSKKGELVGRDMYLWRAMVGGYRFGAEVWFSGEKYVLGNCGVDRYLDGLIWWLLFWPKLEVRM